jgi:hypothetical protein
MAGQASKRPGMEAHRMWRTTFHAVGVEVDDRLRASIDRQLRDALEGLEVPVGLVHVRLYGDGTGSPTCYIRVEAVPSGSIALGDSAPDIEGAVARAVSRIGTAARRIEDGQWSGNRVPEARTSPGHTALTKSRLH